MDMPIDKKKLIAWDLYDHALDANIRRLLKVYTQQQTDDKQFYNDFVSKLEAIFNLMLEESKLDNSYNHTYKNYFILNDISNDIFRFIDKDKTRQENVAFSFEEGSDQPVVGYFNDQQVFIPTKSIKEALFKSSTPMKKALSVINTTIYLIAKGLAIVLAVYYLFFLLIVGFINLFNDKLNETFNQEIEMLSTSPEDAFSGLVHFFWALLEPLFK